MERRQHHRAEGKDMDACLRRLKQELQSMKEAGDGLHVQMNTMMGALQELKLLRVQTALENLNISAQPVQRGMTNPAPPTDSVAAPAEAPMSEDVHHSPSSPSPSSRSRNNLNRVGNGSSQVSLSDTARTSRSQEDGENLETFPKRWSGYTAPQVDFCGPVVGNPSPSPPTCSQHEACDPPPAQAVDLPGILYSLSREGPSLDGNYTEDNTDDSGDWTSSLMNRSRNRQPLVLGDNVFADLVGNWLDLPEVEQEEMDKEDSSRRPEGTGDRPGTPVHPLRLSRSQEICRKFSLTSNIFKKFLRSVRPDRDKLLKERPGWMAPELQEDCNLFKRPKKVVPKSTKGSFYLPFWANGQQGKGRSCPRVDEPQERQQPQQSFPEIYLDRRQTQAGAEKMPPLFDYNTAVWV